MALGLQVGKWIAGLLLSAQQVVAPMAAPPAQPVLMQEIRRIDPPVASRLTDSVTEELRARLALLQSA
jgi:hypothetical protein